MKIMNISNYREETETNLQKLRNSDTYIRVYNSKEERMPEASQILDNFNYPVNLCNIGRSILAQVKDNGDKVEVFPKYIVETNLYDNEVIEGFTGTIGLLVNNNSNTISIYSGMMAHACLNLSIFNTEYIQVINLLNSLDNLKNIVNSAKDKLLEKLQYIKLIKDKLEAETYTESQFIDKKGEILNKIPLNLFGYIEHSEKVLRDANSIYHGMPNSSWKILSSFTDLVSKQSPTKRIEATLALEKMFS
jgi:hypothetical protein